MNFPRIVPTSLRSIQARFLLTFLLSAFFAIVMVVILNQWIRTQLIEQADTTLLTTALSAANRIDEFHRSNLQAFEMAAGLPLFEEYVQSPATIREISNVHEQTLATLNSLQVHPWNQFYALSFALLDKDGTNLIDTAPANLGQYEGDLPATVQVLQVGIPVISTFYFSAERSSIYYDYVTPIRRTVPPQTILGALRVRVSVSTIQDIVDVSAEQSESGLDFMLFDSNLVRIADTQHPQHIFRTIADYSPEQVQQLTNDTLLPPLAFNEVVQPLPSLAGVLSQLPEPVVVTDKSEPNAASEQRIAAVSLKTVPWKLIVAKPADAYFLPIQRQTQGILLLSIVLMIGAVMTSMLIARSVTRPIRQLTQVAHQVAAGNLRVQAPVTSSDEIGVLATTFNQMTTELDHIKSNLEELVAERTHSLSEANKALIHEIAERQRYEKQALELALEHERMRILSEFIQDVSHEFKTPLSVINVKAYLMRHTLGDAAREYADQIEQQAKSIDSLVSMMVLMSRLDSGVTMELMRIEMDKFIKMFSANVAATAEKSELHLTLDLQAGGSTVIVDPQMLHHALESIIENACKFTPPGGEITLATRREGDSVQITIRDTGVGISAEALPRVFERFYRVDEAHTTRGFGLGLPIAKRIVEHFDGTIRIASTPGSGTTVTIELPLTTAEYHSQPTPTREA